MPNWCETTYKCVGEPKEVRSLYNAIKKNDKRKTPRVKNGFGNLWLGCIIDQLGGDWNKYQCRGEITYYEIEKDASMLTIYQETAWCEQEGFRHFIQEKFPSIEVYFLEEEPGCEVYYTNSFEYFPDRFYLDCYEDPQYFETIEEVAKYVTDFTGKEVENSVDSIQNALDEYTEEKEAAGEDVFFSLHEIGLTDN